MTNELGFGLIYACALALCGALLVWGIPMGAISISRSVHAFRTRRARRQRRAAFHKKLRRSVARPGVARSGQHRAPPRRPA